jgi:putative phosphoesterase
MRIAVLCDIHGNLPALDAVLRQVEREPVDRFVIGGDVLPGPMPRETVERVMRLEKPVDYLFGNGEVAVLAELQSPGSSKVPEKFRTGIQWNALQLTQEQAGRLARWPKTVRLDVPGIGSVLFCHGTPRSEDEIFTRVTPEELLRPIFDPLDAAMIVCGHTHMQFDRMIGRTRVVNAGSVGMPFGRTGADWLLLGPDVQLRQTTYDLAAAADTVRATGYPEAQEFAGTYMLNPPSEEDILKVYGAAELRSG